MPQNPTFAVENPIISIAIEAPSQESAVVDEKRRRNEEEINSKKRPKANKDMFSGAVVPPKKRDDARVIGASNGQLHSESVSSSAVQIVGSVVKKPAKTDDGMERHNKYTNNENMTQRTKDRFFEESAKNEKVIQFAEDPFCFLNVYLQLPEYQTAENIEIYKASRWIGKLRIPLEARLFGSLILTKVFKIQDILQGMNRESSAMCALCKEEVDDCSHMFFECPFARAVWDAQRIRGVDITTHLTFWNSIAGSPNKKKLNGRTLFAVLWAIWLQHFNVIFKGVEESVDCALLDVVNIDASWARGGW